MRRLDTTYSTLTWSADGSRVTKARPTRDDTRFDHELRVNQLLLAQRPPVPAPALVDRDLRGRTLTFEAVAGETVGPKYPIALGGDDVDALVDLARRMARYQPRRRWFRRLDSGRRLARAGAAGLLGDHQVAAATDLADRWHRRRRFAHGDLTARNVVRSGGELWLIDWEWAGLYPPGYELAFLWFSLVDVPGGRSRVEQAVRTPEPAFLLSALLVQLWHLEWFVPAEFRPKHEATRDELLDRLSL